MSTENLPRVALSEDGSVYEATMPDGTVRQLERVTHILGKLDKPGLYRWHAKCTADWWMDRVKLGWSPAELEAGYDISLSAAPAIRDHAAMLGTTVHNAIQAFLVHDRWPDTANMPGEATHAFYCWHRWWSQARMAPLLPEQVVYNIAQGYAGTLDLVGERDGMAVMLDWKTSSSLHPITAWQMAAYALALKEMGQIVPRIGMVVRLPKRFDQHEVEVVTVWDNPQRLGYLQAGFTALRTAVSLLPTLGVHPEVTHGR